MPKRGRAQSLADVCRGMLLGTVCGDILGAAVEMLPAEVIAERYGRVRTFLTSERPFGHYTDDSQMTIALAWSIVQREGMVDAEHCAGAYAEFFEEWRGYGRGARSVMQALKTGASYTETGTMFIKEGSLGNGGAMRIAPVGIAFRNAPPAVLFRAVDDAVMCTHRHPEGVDGAFVQAAAVQSLARLALADAPASISGRPRAGFTGAPEWEVELRVRAETTFGDTLYVVGDWLGWDVSEALEMATSAEEYPLWRAKSTVPVHPGRSLEYKYFIKRGDGPPERAADTAAGPGRGEASGLRWEACERNRVYAPPGRFPVHRQGDDEADEGRVLVDDGWFDSREEGGAVAGDVDPFALIASLRALARTDACRNKLAALQEGLDRMYGPRGGPRPKRAAGERAALEQEVAKRLMGECGIQASEGVAVALWAFCLHWRDPVECLAAAVGYGGDVDTFGAMAGALLGTLHGAGWIPDDWRSQVENTKWGLDDVERLAVELAAAAASGDARRTSFRGERRPLDDVLIE